MPDSRLQVLSILTMLLRCPEEQRWQQTQRASAMITAFPARAEFTLTEYLRGIGAQVRTG